MEEEKSLPDLWLELPNLFEFCEQKLRNRKTRQEGEEGRGGGEGAGDGEKKLSKNSKFFQTCPECPD
jgi:hypothetical protein